MSIKQFSVFVIAILSLTVLISVNGAAAPDSSFMYKLEQESEDMFKGGLAEIAESPFESIDATEDNKEQSNNTDKKPVEDFSSLSLDLSALPSVPVTSEAPIVNGSSTKPTWIMKIPKKPKDPLPPMA